MQSEISPELSTKIRQAALKFWTLSPEERDERLQLCLDRGLQERPEIATGLDLAVLLVQLELCELDQAAGHG